MIKSLPVRRFPYPYEEFADHLKALCTVRQWEYTSRFGHLGSDQTSRANNARILEYFSDCYTDSQEAVHKAELLLSIYDYIGRNVLFFSRKGVVDVDENNVFSVDPGLLRAIHHLFTAAERPTAVDPKKVLALARAFNDLELAA